MVATIDSQAIASLISGAYDTGRLELSELESKKLLAHCGIATAMPRAARSASEAAHAAAEIGFPVALKVLSPEATHKTEVGGVVLNLRAGEEVERAYWQIERNLRTRLPTARFEGVAVQEMAAPGVELIVGLTRDPTYGPLVLVGLGGIYAELLNDTSLRLGTITEREACDMLEELRGAAMLRGWRGQPPSDLDAVAGLLATLSRLAEQFPAIQEMDLNPVVVYAKGLMVLDARVRFDGPVSREAAGKIGDPRRVQRIANLERAFNARTVAVIGDKQAGDYLWLRSQADFKGKLYSVQIDPNELPGIAALGVENRASLADIPEHVDYAITAVPRSVTPRILADCIRKEVAGVCFFTSGFSETEEELGRKLEAELRAQARNSDIALIGPNCMGLYNPEIGIKNYPGLSSGQGGDVAFISQSGTHAIHFGLQAPVYGIQVNKTASIGNAITLGAADYLEVFTNDPATRAIGMYFEGTTEGTRLFQTMSHVARRHPLVVLKGGSTEAGARASFSHTASLSTPAAVWKAVVRQSGAVEVANMDGMLDALALFSRGRPVSGKKVGLIAMTGGQSVLITDSFARAGLEVPALSATSYEELGRFFNIVGGSYRNPLDAAGTVGVTHPQRGLVKILKILDRDDVLDSIVLEIGTGFQAARWTRNEQELIDLLDALAEFNQQAHKQLSLIMHPSHLEATVARARTLAHERGLVTFASFDRAAVALALAEDYHRRRQLS